MSLAGEAQNPALELAGVEVALGGRLVLRGVSLAVQARQLWAVLGPNGSGKSTLVKTALGLREPVRGAVKLFGTPLPELEKRVRARAMAWVPQSEPDGEALGFTALESVLLGRSPWLDGLGLPSEADVAKAKAALEALNIGAFAARALSELSGGERRLVALARALAQEPKVLVLDEPTAFLDVKHQVATLSKVRARVDAGLAGLCVLHDANQATAYATHALLLQDGTVRASGPVEQVVTAEALTALYGADIIELKDGAHRVFSQRVARR